MGGLKKHRTDFIAHHAGETVRNKVTNDEIDGYVKRVYMYPSDSVSWFGTAEAGSATEEKAFVMLNQQADYPRTPLVTVTNSSGSVCAGTVNITGVDQFGNTISESIALLGTENTTAAGTGIYRTITAGTITFGTATEEDGTATLGVALGTTSGVEGRLGLGFKIGTTSDVKRITWINNGAATGLSAGTIISDLVSATSHSFRGSADMTKTDIFIVEALPYTNAVKNTDYDLR